MLSARHGDRMSNADLKSLAEEEFENDPSLDPQVWGGHLGVSKNSVYRWVSHIINREKAGRANKAWRLSRLGWTNKEIGELLGVTEGAISADRKDSGTTLDACLLMGRTCFRYNIDDRHKRVDVIQHDLAKDLHDSVLGS